MPDILAGWGYTIEKLGKVPRINVTKKLPTWKRLPAFACRVNITHTGEVHVIQAAPNESEEKMISRALIFARARTTK